MNTLSFKPKQVTKKLLAVLPERSREVLVSRYGLGADAEKMTLEAIGKLYHITRERVRQIENYALSAIRKSDEYKKEKASFDELVKTIENLGGIVVESDLLVNISKDESTQNHLHFLLVAGESFKKLKEDEEFKHRWYVDDELADNVHGALRKFYKSLSDNDLIPESEVVSRFLDHVKDMSVDLCDEEVAKRWLGISKQIGKNPLGEWGLTSSPNINIKGMRDCAFLVIRRHGSPIHFREVANSIEKMFGKKAHVATTHNELIKDPRFVLVGRGLYALAEWGYLSGVVREVIKKIIDKNGPITKDKIIEKVLKERYVKENTILVNLQNPKYFKKDKEGKYSVVGA